MNYLSIQTLAAVFQGSISLLPLLMAVWHELRINEKLRAMEVNKHHGTSFHENVHHMTYLPFINAKSTNQLADNLPYHQRVFTYLWDKVNPIKWWQLTVSVSDELLFGQKQFPNDDTPMEKFGINMGNISGVRLPKGRIGIGYVAFLHVCSCQR